MPLNRSKIKMSQKVAKRRLFAFKTSQLRSLSTPSPLFVRSDDFCTFAVPSGMGLYASGFGSCFAGHWQKNLSRTINLPYIIKL